MHYYYFQLIILISSACSLSTAQSNLWQLLSSFQNASTFANYINEVGLSSQLTAAGCTGSAECYTILLPTNDGMSTIANELAWSSKDISQKFAFLHGHFIKAKASGTTSGVRLTTNEWTKIGQQVNFLDIGLGTGTSYNTLMLSQRYAFMTMLGTTGLYFLNHVEVVTPDIVASNGIIQMIDKPIFTPDVHTTFLDFIRGQRDLKVSFELWCLLLADPNYGAFVTQMSDNQPLYSTMFLVTDSGWSSVPQVQLTNLRQNLTLLISVLSHHYSPNQLIFSEWTTRVPTLNIFTGFPKNPKSFSKNELNAAMLYKTLDGKLIVSSGFVSAELESKNYLIQNAVLHKINKPLGFVFKSREDLLAELNPFLLSACKADTVCNDLFSSSTNELTILSPTASAMQQFNTLSLGNKTIYLQYLFLTTKIIKNQMNTTRFITINDLQDAIRFRVDGQITYVEGRLPKQGYVAASIVQSDLMATNGVLHILDAIPGLPYETVGQYIARTPHFSEYYKYHFVDNMKAGEPYTFLAPIDAALNKMYTDSMIGSKLLMDEKRRNFIFRRLAFPLNLHFNELKTEQYYNVPTANYAFTREYVRLLVRVANQNLEASLMYQDKTIVVKGATGYQCTNGLLYPVDSLLYTNDDLTTSMCTSRGC